ncbi:hypothetical protein WMY93_009517 [Mugilogobius chulae]|uniref:non-chaperonin molecular chaperone ATPase n=1 Tax=Mugilogobius chulae TaxID=88201 RepID=A0AAW0PFF9_9GOBI
MSSKKNKSKSKRTSEGDSSLGLKEDEDSAGQSVKNSNSFTVIDFIEKAEDKTPKSCRSWLAQMGLNSMKAAQVCIGRPVLLTSSAGQDVCLGWPVVSFPGGKVGLQKCALSNLKVKQGEEVVVQPVTGPVLQATEVLLSSRSKDDKLDTDEFKNFFIRSLDGNIILPGNNVSLSYFGRSCNLRIESIQGEDGVTLMRPAPPLGQDTEVDESSVEPQALDCSSADLSLQMSFLRVEDSGPHTPSSSGDTGPTASTPRRTVPCPPLTSLASPSTHSDNSQNAPTEALESPQNPEQTETYPTAPSGGVLNTDTFYCLSCSTNNTEEQFKSTKVSYRMIGGLSNQLDVIRETIELPLKNPELFANYGIPPPRGVLLYGPPGTGKTMIGRAIANEVGAHMTVINGPEIMSKFYGETEARLRQIFNEASQRQPAIIFIDELDALCPKREGAQNEVEKRVVASLLTLMDGIGSEGHSGQLLVLEPQIDLTPSTQLCVDPGALTKNWRSGSLVLQSEQTFYRSCCKRFLTMPCLSWIRLNRMPLSDGKSPAVSTSAPLPPAPPWLLPTSLQCLCGENTCALAGLVCLRLHALRRALGGSTHLSDQQLKGKVTVTLQDLKWAMSVVKPSAMREVAIDVPKVRWSDIGGMEEVKLKLKQAVEWPLKHPEAFTRMGIQPPKGVLLYGPPGCSKTMIAKALANESGLNFLAIKGPELLSKYVGESERAVREVFRKARTVAPSIVFFDEIDALASERGSSSGSGGVGDRVLAQLLTEMDGIEQLRDVTVLAATNRPDMMDKALMRPGRLDRIVYVPLPDASTRREIFSLQFRNMPIAPDVSIDQLVSKTDKYSGAEITAVCREAALLALQEDIKAQSVRARHLEQALITVQPRIPDSLIQSYVRYQQRRGGGLALF